MRDSTQSGLSPSPTPLEMLTALSRERPSFHHAGFAAPAGTANWAISDPVLTWLANELPTGGVTLETGAGYSTVLFAAASRQHIAISSTSDEMRLIASFCERHALATDHVTHYAGRSQIILPTLDLPPLDCILIDGDHAFPVPYMDWYFTAEHLKLGGLLLNDDLHLRSCLMLDQFLKGEARAGRWRRIKRLKNTSVWERLAAGTVTAHGHGSQPFSREWSPLLRAQHTARRLKRRVLGSPCVQG